MVMVVFPYLYHKELAIDLEKSFHLVLIHDIFLWLSRRLIVPNHPKVFCLYISRMVSRYYMAAR